MRLLRRIQARRIIISSDIDPKEKAGVDLRNYVGDFTKEGAHLSPDLIDRLRIDIVSEECPSANSGRYFSSPYLMDTTHHFVLVLKRGDLLYGIAVLGFEIKVRRGNIIVKQIQALAFKNIGAPSLPDIKEVISSLKWERLLVKIAEVWAMRHGFKVILIKKAEANEYSMRSTTIQSIRERNERLRMHYDVTARRMKYTPPGPKSNYFTKILR